ncbi:MAG TPA: hypothetical protein VNL73_11505 [Verrucomicrobiae bacterium]|nr:hypothetical protein [Verrucomicrobiae bacterium]
MTKKPLLLCAVFLLLSSAVWAGEETAFEPNLPQNPTLQNLLPMQPMLDCTSNYMRGDFNINEFLDLDDVVVMLNCVFADPRGRLCLPCIVDMNCDNFPTPVDVILLLRFVWEPPIFEIKCPD